MIHGSSFFLLVQAPSTVACLRPRATSRGVVTNSRSIKKYSKKEKSHFFLFSLTAGSCKQKE